MIFIMLLCLLMGLFPILIIATDGAMWPITKGRKTGLEITAAGLTLVEINEKTEKLELWNDTFDAVLEPWTAGIADWDERVHEALEMADTEETAGTSSITLPGGATTFYNPMNLGDASCAICGGLTDDGDVCHDCGVVLGDVLGDVRQRQQGLPTRDLSEWDAVRQCFITSEGRIVTDKEWDKHANAIYFDG